MADPTAPPVPTTKTNGSDTKAAIPPPPPPPGGGATGGQGGSGQRVPVSIEEEMRTSYLDYSMSVIIGRAIPDVRDGLKPVHRRVLYSMHEQKIGPTGAHRKSARVVGDVLGKYHPHGDASVYEALARLAQPWSLRNPLIDGQGNFGSVDGDRPAALMRYTEARLSRVATELLADIEKDTVDFVSNFDDSEQEPSVLPARYPNLLVNGSGGIAVGMATNIPPHNLGEIIDATVHLIGNPECTVADLMEFVKGPDFPTAALIYGTAGIRDAYEKGRGRIVMRARSEVKKLGKGDREQIVVTEIPYQVNKATLVAKIAELIRDKKLEGVSNVEDHSDRDGMSIAIELRKDIYPQVVLNQLYRLTEMQTTFGVINLVIDGGRPRVLDLKQTLEAFVAHRREVVTRRTRFDLRQAEAQLELVEGLGMALTELDLVIATIRNAKDRDTAREELMKLKLRGLEAFVARAGRPAAEIAEARKKKNYTLSERQANAILEMRLSRLTGLEREKLEAEYNELGNLIARLKEILGSETKLMEVITTELKAVRDAHADKRRTEIVRDEAEINIEDLIQEEDMVVTISHAGYIKRTPATTYRAQKRGGKGKLGMEAREEDFINQLFIASTHAYVFFFSDRGKVYVKKVYEVPLAARNAKGRAIVNFVGMEPGEKVAAIVEVPKIEPGRFVVTLTRGGIIKKTELTDYENFREKGIIGVKIEGDDQLLSAALTDGTRQIMIGTRDGMSIRFEEEQVRSMGRATYGVKGIELREGDVVVGFAITEDGCDQVLAITERGYGKRTLIEHFRSQHRGGVGVALIDTGERNGPCVGIRLVSEQQELMLITNQGQALRTRCAEIRQVKDRGASGVRIMTLAEGEHVVAFERLAEAEVEGGDSIPPAGDA